MYPLTPIVSPQIRTILSQREQIFSWIRAFGSPLNLIFPEAVWENAQQFLSVLQQNTIRGTIFYAHKANKSKAILTELATKTIGVDVASEQELCRALNAGFSGNRLEATGPKHPSFLRLCILHGVTINLHSMNEFQHLLAMRRIFALQHPIRLFIRIKTLSSSSTGIIEKDNKFGLDDHEIRKVLEQIINQKNIEFLGFSFHVTTVSMNERIAAIRRTIEWTIEAIKLGLSPQGINIGGGFSINFLERADEWHAYVSALKTSLLDPSHPRMSWNDAGLGFWAENGKIRGDAAFQDFYRPMNQFEELSSLLSHDLGKFGSLGQFLHENAFSLFIEPGRSLLGQVGVTLGEVISIHQSRHNQTVIFLAMNRSNLNASDLEFMADPVIISKTTNNSLPQPSDGVYLSGNLCLPHDFLCRRKVFLKQSIQVGDILAFVNTGGYFMDFTESETISHPVAKKIAINRHGWYLDDAYQPTEMANIL